MKDENDILESEINNITNKCDDIIYSISFVSPNYPSDLIKIQKDNSNDKSKAESEENPLYDPDMLLEYKIKNIVDAKAIKGELWYLVELSNGEIMIIPNKDADRFISDNDMIDFLTNKIKKNTNNSIPKLSKNDIANNPHTSFFQLPYILSKSPNSINSEPSKKADVLDTEKSQNLESNQELQNEDDDTSIDKSKADGMEANSQNKSDKSARKKKSK